MISSGESEEEINNDFLYWNNWNPERKSSKECTSHDNTTPVRKKYTPKFTKPVKCYGDYIPPCGLLDVKRSRYLSKAEHAAERNVEESCASTSRCDNIGEVVRPRTSWNADWGQRQDLSDISALKEGELTWDVIDPALFGCFKLWCNEGSQVCGMAEAEVGAENGEKSLIVSNNKTHLRKLLGVSCSEWSSLEETLQLSPVLLKFEAFNLSPPARLPPLDRLWFLLCKSRHCLPPCCLRVRRAGGVKLKKVWKILTKLIVEDVRDWRGRDIL